MLQVWRCLAVGAVTAASLSFAAELAAQPRLVADLNRGSNSAYQQVTLLDPVDGAPDYYFIGSDDAHGTELWRTDGTAGGTVRVSDICPGRCGSNPGQPVVFKGRLWFAAEDGASGQELWQSDGTPGSERPLRDLCPGPCSSTPEDLAAFDDLLLFTILTPEQHRVLWTSDGTAQGTVALADFGYPRDSDFAILPGTFRKIGGAVFFNLLGESTRELWRTDGTVGGTQPLGANFGTELYDTTPVVPFGGAGYFWTHDGLWRTDGSLAGTVKVRSNAEIGIALPSFTVGAEMVVWNGRLYTFGAGNSGFLVISDGTAAGTFRTLSLSSAGSPVSLTGGLVFAMWEEGKTTLLRLQGTPGPLETIFEIDPGQIEYGLFQAGGNAYFIARSWIDDSRSFWITDGTAAGTRLVDEGPEGIYQWAPLPDGELYTTAIASSSAVWHRHADGTGAVPLHDFAAGPGSAGPLSQAVLGGRLVFSAQTSANAAPLFISDGTPERTRLLRRDAPWASRLTPLGRRLYFTSQVRSTTDYGYPVVMAHGLWATDGTPDGTLLMSQPLQNIGSPLMPFHDAVFFAGDFFGTRAYDDELWRTTGRPQDSVLVKNINLQRTQGWHEICYRESSLPGPGIVIGDRLVFAADNGLNGRELWSTDGTGADTRLLKDINLGRHEQDPDGFCDSRRSTGDSSNPDGFLSFRQGALFTADDGRWGRELWWTDGTTEGTRRVVSTPGGLGSSPRELTLFQGAAWFFAAGRDGGDALWTSDGTAPGTFEVHDLRIDGQPSWARELTAAGDKLFFAVYNPVSGSELWASRGDSGSTGLVTEIRPGTAGSYPQSLTAVGDVLIFAATDGATGLEAWRTDGTAAGTRRLADIAPGSAASSPGPFSVVGNQVLTGADDAVHGRELWAIPLEDVLRP